jgi:hypothetical protein
MQSDVPQSMKRTARILAIALALMLILGSVSVLISSCAASSKDGSSAPDYDEAPAETTYPAGDEGGAPPAQDDTQPENSDRKIVRNASLDLKAVDVESSYESILEYARGFGGYETQRDQTDQDGYMVIRAVIKLPPEKLDLLISFVRDQSGTELVNTRISSEDITESYYDTEIRLDNMEKQLERYYEYLEDSRNIEEMMTVQYQIDSLTLEIESLKGKLKLWDSMLAESRVELYIRQVSDPVQVRKEVNWKALTWDDMSYLMTSGLKSVINVLAGVGQWLLIVIVAAAPLWIPALIIIIVLIRRGKKKKARRIRNFAAENPLNPANTLQSAQMPASESSRENHKDIQE